MQRILILPVLLAAFNVQAEPKVLKVCTSQDGQVIYTDSQCPEGSTLKSSTPVDPSMSRKAAPVLIVPREPPSSGYAYDYGATVRPREPTALEVKRARCAEVKRRVSIERERLGNNYKYSQLRSWSDRVSNACRGT